MSNEPLFFAPPAHEKVAGYKMPSNPRFWQSEIIRYLKSQHPYLPMESAEIDLRRMDATKGAAVGSVVLGQELAVPIIIKRPRPGADPELSPMDVFFHKGKYQFLDPETIKNLTHSPQIGEPEKKKDSRAFGGNPYIGDVTGDATPLEYSGQASPFAGPYDGAKVSMDISEQLLPKYMLKDAAEKKKSQTIEKAKLFGITGTVGGGIRGALTGKGGVKSRATNALHQAAIGMAAGTGAGAVAGKISERGRDKEQKRLQTMVKREIKKLSAYTAGIDAIAENGIVARMLKEAYLDPNDVSNFRRMLATNPHILQGSGHNLRLVEMMARRGPNTPSFARVKHPNIMQVYERGGIVYIKFSGGPETKTTKEELKATVGDRYPEIMSKLKSGGVYMRHDGVQRVTWDVKRPMSEAKQIDRDGLYAVRTRQGENIVGMVCQAIMDVDGKTLPLKLFVSPEGKYAITGEMFGVQLAAKHRIPAQVPAGGATGVFINYVHGTPISTMPLRLINVRKIKTEDGEERTLYVMQNQTMGTSLTLSPVPGVQGFERMHVIEPSVKAMTSGPVYYMPGDSEWVTLKNPVRLAESVDELTKISEADDDLTHVTYTGGQWNIVKLAVPGAGFLARGTRQAARMLTNPRSFLGGVKKTYQSKGLLSTAKKYAPGAAVVGAPVAAGAMLRGGGEKSGNKYYKFSSLDAPDARELLTAMGMVDVDEVQAVLDRAHERSGIDRGVKIAGLHEPQIQGFDVVDMPEPTYDEATIKFANDCKPGVDLIKAAAESGHPETLDALLSLEFITPQNLKYFVDNIPDLEEASTRLAALLISVRLGMPHVPEQPVKDALEGLSKTLNKLLILKSALDHKNERVSTVA